MKSKYLYFLILTLVVSFYFTKSVSAVTKATCYCSVTCNLNDGSFYEPSTHWAKRPNGRNFAFPLSSREKNECQSYCKTHVQNLDVESIAKERGACGAYSCKGISRIGPPNPNRDIGTSTKTGTYECKPETPDPQKIEYQYSSKIVCGTPEKERVVIPGSYQSAVNVHNPQYEDVLFRRKVARAGFATDGEVSKFIHGKIGPDGVQVFDCHEFENQLKPNSSLTDGYFVIESKAPLDVTTYYTGGNKTVVRSLDVEKTFEREIPEKEWLCDGGNKVSLDLSDPSIWKRSFSRHLS